MDIAHVAGHQLCRDLGKRYVSACHGNLLRVGVPKPQNGKVYIRACVSAKQLLGVCERHIPRRDTIDALDKIARRDVRLIRRGSRQSVNHSHVAVSFCQNQAHTRACGVLILLILPVLVGIEVTGERIDRFKHPVDSAQRDALHVRLFNVLQLDALENLGVHLQVPVNVVRCYSTSRSRAKQQKTNNHR